jgi:translation initiation factor 2 alpha subunit (eIF-2alpha)
MKKNFDRAMKVGRVEVARVTKVDAFKGTFCLIYSGYIDLSKSKVTTLD